MTKQHIVGTATQCLSCKRRHVKCDSTPNACLRCQVDNIECPGYQKALKWNHFTVARRLEHGVQHLGLVESESNGQKHLATSIRPAPRLSKQDRESAIVHRSVEYFNTELIPYSSPAQLPFKRNHIPADLWHFVPDVLQHTLIVLVRARQAGKSFSDPVLRPDLCHYRGLSLTGLQGMLTDSKGITKDPHGVALMSVLFIMAADILLCDEHWTVHLEAARRIIGLRGGISKCFEELPNSNGPLLGYLVVDVLTATTCNSWLLSATFTKAQLGFLDVLPDLEQELLANGHPCPAQIMQAILCTNVLRVCNRRQLTRDETIEVARHQISFEQALDVIESFDSNDWATRVGGYGRTLPQKPNDALSEQSVAALACLAICFKNAAILYLLLSVPGIVNGRIQATATKASLSSALKHLFTIASTDPNGPLHSQLWKFTCWPLLISAYVKAGWDIGDVSVDADIDRMPAIALALGSRRLLGVAKFIREVREKRCEKGDGIWTWDDGFGTRRAVI